MKTESTIARIVWSLAYLFLIALALRAAINSPPVRVEASPPQGQRKSLEEAYSTNPQVRVSHLKVGAEVRRFKEEFEDSDDWPKRLAFEIENISAKPIVFLTVNLNFPDTKSSGNMMSYPIEFGARPTLAVNGAARKPFRLMPGEKLQVKLDNHYAELERFIKIRHNMNQIHKAEIMIGFIVFDDGIAWAAGDFLRPDPSNPRHFFNVGPKPPK